MKQKTNHTYKMGTVKQINIKNRTYYFYNDTIDLENFESNSTKHHLKTIKIKFNSNDDLPLNRPLKFHNMTITIRSIFREDRKLYLQIFLDDTLYKLST